MIEDMQLDAGKIILKLEKMELLFPQFQLVKENGNVKVLGKGGFSEVYEMENANDPDKRYALKVIGFAKHQVTSKAFWETTRYQTILCEESQYVMRVVNARELLLFLDDEGSLLKVEEPDKDDIQQETLRLQFVLMEKLEEVISKDRFKKSYLNNPKLCEEEEVLRLGMQIGQALAVSHSYGIMHRDVKLENIFWDTPTECYKLGDFGISKQLENLDSQTIVYTDGYGAPEVGSCFSGAYTYTADIYSLGITLYLLLNDLRFPGSQGYYPDKIFQYNPESIFPAPKHASREMARVIRKMCSFEAKDRYQTMPEVLMALAGVAKERNLPRAREYYLEASQTTETYKSSQLMKEYSKEEERLSFQQKKKENEKIYRRHSTWNGIGLCVLLTIFLIFSQPNLSIVNYWILLALSFGVALEALFQKIKELQYLFGAVVVAAVLCSILYLGLSPVQIVLLVCVLTGLPAVALAGAGGVAGWLFLVKLFPNLVGGFSVGISILTGTLSVLIIIHLLIIRVSFKTKTGLFEESK